MSDPRKVMVVGSGAVFTGNYARVVCADSNNNNNTITPNSMQINNNLLISSNPEVAVVNTNKVIVNEYGTTSASAALYCVNNADNPVHIKAEKKVNNGYYDDNRSIEMNVGYQPSLKFVNNDQEASIELAINGNLEVKGKLTYWNSLGSINLNDSTDKQLSDLLTLLAGVNLITLIPTVNP